MTEAELPLHCLSSLQSMYPRRQTKRMANRMNNCTSSTVNYSNKVSWSNVVDGRKTDRTGSERLQKEENAKSKLGLKEKKTQQKQ